MYDRLGFDKQHQNPPSYWYVVDGTRKHRWGYRKDAIRDEFPEVYNSNDTEYTMMKKMGYDRIWDAGTILYELHNEPLST